MIPCLILTDSYDDKPVLPGLVKALVFIPLRICSLWKEMDHDKESLKKQKSKKAGQW